MRLAGGLALAAMSAAALGWGFYAQHGAAQRLPLLSVGRPVRSLRALFSNLRWLAGYLVGMVGWALYIAALLLAPLSIVQATSAGGIGLLALLVARFGAVHLSRAERTGVAAALAGLVMLGLSLAGASGDGGGAGHTPWIAVWVAASAFVAALFARPLSAGLAPGAGYGVAAGLLYSAGDVATKAAVAGGARLAFVPVVAACHLAAFALMQLAFQRGRALSTAGTATLLTNALPIAAGIVLFHESVPPGTWGVVRIAAFMSVAGGAGLLARPHPSTPPAGSDQDQTVPANPTRESGEPRDPRGRRATFFRRHHDACLGGGPGRDRTVRLEVKSLLLCH